MQVLLVEPDRELADYLTRGLREEGIIVDHFNHESIAWTAVENAPRRIGKGRTWDVIILDNDGGDQSAIDCIQRLRQAKSTAPVLLLNRQDSAEARTAALQAGADDCMSKPLLFAELLARIRSLARRFNHQGNSVLEYGDIRVDLASQRVTRGGRPVMLTQREYELLVLLMQNPEEVLSRTRIYEHGWQEMPSGQTIALEAFVMRLRRKLEMYGPRVIFTVYGRGYLLSSQNNPSAHR